MGTQQGVRTAWVLVSLCGGLLWMAAPAAGDVLEFEFEGVVTNHTGKTGIFGPPGGPDVVQVGDPFTGRFFYEIGPGNPDQQPGDPQLGAYDLIDFQIDQAIVSITPLVIGIIHEPPLAVLPPSPPDPGTDGVIVAGSFLDVDTVRPVSLRLEAPYQSVFIDDSLPTNLVLEDFPFRQVVRAIVTVGLDGPGSSDVGQLDSLILVPEPSSLTLLVLGGLALLRRRGFGPRV